MAILGITNRTENWKTAETLAPLIADGDLRLKLVQRLGEPDGTLPNEVELELFWYGIRDFLHNHDVTADDLAKRYKYLFCHLREKVEDFPNLQTPNRWNYRTLDVNKMYNNLRNTELDIALETPTRLFIGEAKSESSLVGKGDLVLVHQLIRQYVAARILVDLIGCEKKVAPFVIADDTSKLKRTRQVNFMVQQGWMKKTNVLGWDEVPH